MDIQDDDDKSLKKRTTVASFVRYTFGFNSVPLTFLVVLTTVVLGLLVVVSTSTNPPAVTDAQRPLMEFAWKELQAISSEPHPYFSHANDRVRSHILKRVYEIASQKDHFEGAQVTVDDEQTDIFIQKEDVFDKTAPPGKLTYFEGNNVLVRVSSKDSDKELGAIMLSAHFDSVPTAFGTTDDGAGIATMLAVLHHTLAQKHAPKRDIIFNFNNNEEFGLLGAEAFMHHPWSDNVSAFINLEGTGAGGKAILFRASDYGVASHYSAAEQPFASSVYQEGFANGFIHSQTDYKVYTDAGLRGLDIAFYKPRAIYHTRRDAISETTPEALNHMLVNTVAVTESMASAESFEHAEHPAVFSDIAGYLFVVFPLQYVFIVSCLTLFVGPLFVGLLLFLVLRKQLNAGVETILGGWLRSIVSVGVSIAATYFVVETMHISNELYIVRSFYTPLFAAIGTFILVNYILLGFFHFVRPVCDQKLIILLELSVPLWGLLLMSVIHEAKKEATGEYHYLILYVVVACASILGLFGHLVGSTESHSVEERPQEIENTTESSEATEATPLLASDESTPVEAESEGLKEEPTFQKIANSLSYDWSVQFLLVVPVTFFVTFGLAVSLLDGLHQTPLESEASADFVYTLITGVAVLIGVTFLPFVHKLQVIVPVILAATVISACFVQLLSPPFSNDAPAKIRFVQNINLDKGTNYVSALGRHEVVEEVLSYIPSISDLNCTSRGDGVDTCTYPTTRPWLIDGEELSSKKPYDYSSLMQVAVVPVNETSSGPFDRFDGRFRIQAFNNRGCVLRFNTTRFESGKVTSGVSPVKMVTLRHNRVGNTGKTSEGGRFSRFGWKRDPATGKDEFRSFMHGIDDVSLHKLDWKDPTYDIQLSWIPRWYEVGDPEDDTTGSLKNRLGITVTCSWSEYDTPTLITDEQGRQSVRRKIPAYDELLQYTPSWAIWSNQGRGMVEVSKYVEL